MWKLCENYVKTMWKTPMYVAEIIMYVDQIPVVVVVVVG